MNTSFSRITVLTLLLLASVSLGACTNTMHGAGQDIERAGEEVQDAAH